MSFAYIFGKMQELHLTKMPQPNIVYRILKSSTKHKIYCYYCYHGMRKFYRNVGFFVYKNMKEGDAYVGIKGLMGLSNK